ncbi:FkbM family methyltransferase [Magnetococcus sp. PR-3]|uniref:FkbM family methyltransferase n=1 Tax=Magnetococcus sp. PR-3 TaxID=3120355 RepID=UPI002FCE45BA
MAGLIEKSVNLIPWWLRDHIRKIPFLAWLQRRLFNLLLANKSFDYQINAGPAKGLWMAIAMPDDKLIWTGTWEKVVGETMARLVPQQGVCLDIGSHRGFMAGIMALNGAKAVYCFEPMPENIKHLQRFKQLNAKLPLHLKPYAVGGRQGEASFSIMNDNSMGKLADSSFQSGRDHQQEITVQVRRLDDLVRVGEIEPPHLMKVDVEGAEMEVLEGAVETIEQHLPIMIVEVHTMDLAVACDAWLKARGYQVEVLERGEPLDATVPYTLFHLLGMPPA